jgi:hypothetical protein
LARGAARENRQIGVTEQRFQFGGGDLADVSLHESGLVVGFIGKAAGGVQIDTGDDGQPLQNEAMRQPARTAEQIHTRNRCQSNLLHFLIHEQ